MKIEKIFLIFAVLFVFTTGVIPLLIYADAFSILGTPQVTLFATNSYLINITSYTGNFTMYGYTNSINDFSMVQNPVSKNCIEGNGNCYFVVENLVYNKTVYYKLIFTNGTLDLNTTGSFTTLLLYDFNVTGVSAHNATISFKTNIAVSPTLFLKAGNYVMANMTLPSGTEHTAQFDGLLKSTTYSFYLTVDNVVFSNVNYDYRFVTPSIDYVRSFEITVPSDYTTQKLVNTDHFEISGITESNSLVMLKNSGTGAIYSNQTDDTGTFFFNASLKCVGSGKNYIEIMVRNQENAYAIKNTTVICDGTPPVVDIDVSSLVTNDPIVNFSIGVSENVSIHAWHNKTNGTQILSSFDDGTFGVILNSSSDYGVVILQIDLFTQGIVGGYNSVTAYASAGFASDDGTYVVSFEVSDKVGNKNLITKTISVDHTPPTVVLDDIENPAYLSTIVVSGKTEPHAKVKVVNSGNLTEIHYNREDGKYYKCLRRTDGIIVPNTCDERPIVSTSINSNWIGEIYDLIDGGNEIEADDDGKFSTPVFLGEGDNLIAVSVTDAAGNSVSVDDNSENCKINGRTQCSVTIKYTGTNRDLYVIDSNAFPNIISYDILSSDDVTRREGVVYVTLGSRSHDLSDIIITGADAQMKPGVNEITKKLVKESMSAQSFYDQSKLVVPITFSFKQWTDDPRTFRSTISKITGVGPDANTIKFDVLLHLSYSIKNQNGEAAELADPDPLVVPVSINVQTPDFTGYLTEERVNKWISWIDDIEKVTKKTEDISMEVSKYDMIACAALTAKLYLSSALSQPSPDDYRRMYMFCDRIACPFVPPKCYDLSDPTKLWDSGNTNKFLGVNDKKLDYYFYTSDDLKSAPEDYKRICFQACGAGSTRSCVVRTNAISTQEEGWVTSDVSGLKAMCTNAKTKDEFVKSLDSGQINIGSSCYNAENVQTGNYYELSCLENYVAIKMGGNPLEPHIYGKNPADDIFTSFRCGCFSGFYNHMHNFNILMDNVKSCLNGINEGKFQAGYCQMLVSQYACDWIYSAIQKFKDEQYSPVGGTANKGLADGYYEAHVQNVNEKIGQRYSDTVLDPNTGFGRKGLTYSACLAAFNMDWSMFENAITEVIKEKDIEPTIGPPIGAYSRLMAPDFLTGDISVYYSVPLGMISGGQDLDWELDFYCDSSKKNAKFCPNQYGKNNPLLKYTGTVVKGQSYGETIEKIVKESRGWANMVRLQVKYTLDGEQRTFDDSREIEHYGDLPLGCQANVDPYLMNNASKMFTCTKLGDTAIGGTIRLKSAKTSPPVDFLPGDQVNVKFSLENKMYADDAFLIKYQILATGITPMEGAERVKVTDFLSTGANDINLHLFDLIPDASNNARTFTYTEANAQLLKGSANDKLTSTIAHNLGQIKDGRNFYVDAGSFEVKSVYFTTKLGTFNLILPKGKTLTDANVDLKTVWDANKLTIKTTPPPEKLTGVAVTCSKGKKPVDLILKKTDEGLSTEKIEYHTSDATDDSCTLDAETAVLTGINAVNVFTCGKEGANKYFTCSGKNNVDSLSLEVVNPLGDIIVNVYDTYSTTVLFPAITFIGGATQGSLPAKYPKGQYTMYATMYRDSGNPGFYQGEDTLLPYGPRNQTEEIKFTISDAANPSTRPNVGVIFPPEDYAIACDKGDGTTPKSLLIGLNIENFVPQKLYFNITISGGPNSNVFDNSDAVIDKTKIKNIGLIGSGVDSVGFGNYLILLNNAFEGLTFRAQTGSTTIKIDIYDNADRKGNPVSKLLNVYAVDGGTDCSMGYTFDKVSASVSRTGMSGSATTGSTTTDLASAKCKVLGGIGDSQDSSYTNVCALEGSVVDCSGNKNCFFPQCGTDNNGIQISGTSCAGFISYNNPLVVAAYTKSKDSTVTPKTCTTDCYKEGDRYTAQGQTYVIGPDLSGTIITTTGTTCCMKTATGTQTNQAIR